MNWIFPRQRKEVKGMNWIFPQKWKETKNMNWMTATQDDDVPFEFFSSVDVDWSLLSFRVAICRRYHSQLLHGCAGQCAAVPQCSCLETFSFFLSVPFTLAVWKCAFIRLL
jgi:hypothetical protein